MCNYSTYCCVYLLTVCFQDLFFHYEFNNLLHNLFVKIISYILAGESVSLKKSLFADCKLVDRILRANKANEEAMFVSIGRKYLLYLVRRLKEFEKDIWDT